LLKSFNSLLDKCFEGLVFVIFVAILLVGGMQVFNRFVFGAPSSWSEEFQTFGFIWLVFLAIPIAYKRGLHIGMDTLSSRLPPLVRSIVALVGEFMWLGLAVAIAYFATVIMGPTQFQRSPGLDLRMDWVYSGLVIGGCYLAWLAIGTIGSSIRKIARSVNE
jgi:TRAP-type C4-dicarboxylate transport system permease small subunit